ncbi:MAG: LysM peptidoglycan-binding domain-containing protein [Castellaniella sp.]|uniref:peptidoglycan DD-metalloendopeptidase family protein n=1 Tax=Castellaniella sp. TaxID=1955812 RepID=UPI0011F9B0E9|nr:peptidoglycan DD-metalloendopeptidase family protein [Castellaniella sp.]TAN26704.1 MAG: LysM peptidoglycan-binding domain-containing protein [Castellaniella sp.]
MLVGTLVTEGPFIYTHRRVGRILLLAVLLSTAVLAGCASRSSRAPVSDQSSGTSPASASAAAHGTYTVRAGDTLYKIAQEHGLSVARLSELNNITNPSQLSIGQTLRLEGGAPASSGSASAAVATPVPVTPPSLPAASASEGNHAAASEPASTSASHASDANLISWGWPATGKIIQGFNTSTKGIDIEGNTGSPVLAAADGKVMYAGNGVRGLGNLILLGHTNGFITAYAHNHTLLVKTGATVKKGAKIATIGQTDTTSPRLHFEIRRRGTPVNPLSYLPPR